MSTFEIFVMITAIFAFAYLISNIGLVKAETTSPIPTGCCLQAKDGSICQNMNKLDTSLCNGELLQTSCDYVDNCKKGCCYDSNSGICSLNSPKEKCGSGGGNWTDSAICNIAQCQLGCCVLGNEAPLITSRECSKLANEYGFKKNFQAVGSDGGCDSYADLYEEGACVLSEGECSFTTKQSCQSKSGSFYKDFLCTNPDLKTVCIPKVKDEFITSCVENKDQIYFIDSCGNRANIYDSSRANDPEYWKKVVSKESSCQTAGASCGNCDYLTGSVCKEYRPGKDAKPDMGNDVCRNLNCLNGKKHGESWCITDYDSSQFGVSPVGSRFFRGICMDGEISIEGCADFNQEICIQGTYAGGTFTEATCRINNWRSCLAANSDNATYDEIKDKCDKLPDDCVMFLDIPGNERYENYPGFIKGDLEYVDAANYGGGKSNTANGASDEVGKDANVVIPRCVPKYNPGMVFWQSSNDTTTKGNTGQQQNSMGYGGSLEETTAICALGGFTCVGKKHTSSVFGSWDWWDNAVCSEDATKTPIMMEALNERCRSLGPCGLQVNVAGELGSNNKTGNFTKMVKIDRDGGQGDWKSSYQKILDSYLEELKSKPGVITPGTMKSLDTAPSGGDSSEVAGSGSGTGSVPTAPNDLSSTIQEAKDNSGDTADAGLLMGLGGGALSVAAMTAGGGSVLSLGGSVLGAGGGIALGAAAWAAVGAVAGYIIGQLVGRWGHMSASETNALGYGLATAGASLALGAYLLTSAYIAGGLCATTGAATLGIGCIIGILIAAIMLILSPIVYILTYEAESEYYVTQYTCQPWEPPRDGNCDSCNADIRQCSENRCRSLGTNCQYYNVNGEPGWCASLTDTFSATIIPWPDALTAGHNYIGTQELKTTIVKGNSEDLDPYSTITFGVETNKPTLCKIDTKHTKTFEEMTYNMLSEVDETGKTGSKHKVALSPFVTSTSSSTTDSATTGTGTTTATGAATSTPDTTTDTTATTTDTTTATASAEASIATLPMKIGANTYYIRCRNYAGQFNAAEFVVRVNVDEGPDLTAPIITKFIPETNSYVAYGSNITTVQFYVNEPGECRYSKDYNLNYDDMNKKTTSANIAVLGEFLFYTALNLTGEDNIYYFKCKDTAGNKNENAYEYSLKSCQSGLNITSKSPSGEIKIGTETANVELYLKTSGCIEGGKAICSFNFAGAYTPFYTTDTTEHSQEFTTMQSGDYNIPVQCEDIAGNIANDIISFNLTIANTAPIVTFASKSGGTLKIITNEPAECRYAGNNTDSCSFSFEEGTRMTDTLTIHTAQYEKEKTYYIKCRNMFNVTNSDCGIVVRPGE